jgi:hypothetical protein
MITANLSRNVTYICFQKQSSTVSPMYVAHIRRGLLRRLAPSFASTARTARLQLPFRECVPRVSVVSPLLRTGVVTSIRVAFHDRGPNSEVNASNTSGEVAGDSSSQPPPPSVRPSETPVSRRFGSLGLQLRDVLTATVPTFACSACSPRRGHTIGAKAACKPVIWTDLRSESSRSSPPMICSVFSSSARTLRARREP